MKTLLTFALRARICLLHHSSAAPRPWGPWLDGHCCPYVTRSPVPRAKIQNVVRSHSKCQVKSIIVTTVCEMKICLDASWLWGMKLLADFEKSTANKTSPSAPFNTSPCGNKSRKV